MSVVRAAPAPLGTIGAVARCQIAQGRVERGRQHRRRSVSRSGVVRSSHQSRPVALAFEQPYQGLARGSRRYWPNAAPRSSSIDGAHGLAQPGREDQRLRPVGTHGRVPGGELVEHGVVDRAAGLRRRDHQAAAAWTMAGESTSACAARMLAMSCLSWSKISSLTRCWRNGASQS